MGDRPSPRDRAEHHPRRPRRARRSTRSATTRSHLTAARAQRHLPQSAADVDAACGRRYDRGRDAHDARYLSGGSGGRRIARRDSPRHRPGPRTGSHENVRPQLHQRPRSPLRVRPSVIRVEGSGAISYGRLRWSTWGSSTAHAKGRQCSAPTGACQTASIRLSDRKTIRGRRVYTCLRPLLPGEVKICLPSPTAS